MPERALTHEEMASFAHRLCLPHFRGIFTRDRLPRGGPRDRECAVINLDDARGEGTHFVAYVKRGTAVRYFDSFGLPPPPEFLTYMRGKYVTYNMTQVQQFDSENCGRLCLQFLFYEWLLS